MMSKRKANPEILGPLGKGGAQTNRFIQSLILLLIHPNLLVTHAPLHLEEMTSIR